MNKFLEQLKTFPNSDLALISSKNKSFFLQTRSYRGSQFRGVSKNGTKWQVMIVRGKLKKYIGAIDDENIAGILYDKYAIMIHGLQVSQCFSTSVFFIS